MKSKKFFVLIVALNLLIIAVSAFFYPRMPETIASHWNAAGQADGYSSRFWGLFMLPMISVAVSLLLLFIPRLDPLKANIEKFKNYYFGFVIVFLLFFFYLHLLTILFNLGYVFSMTLFLIPAFAALFYFTGIILSKAKRNYFVGIRTPWTLANETVWNKTHALGGRLFKIAAIISLLGLLIQQYAFLLMIAPVIIAAIITTAYSYFVFRQEMNSGKPA